MLGNRIIDEWTGIKSQNNDWKQSLSTEEEIRYKKLIKQFNKKHKRKNFDIDTDVDFVNLDEDAKSYFKSVGKGKASIDGLNKSMSETMKVTGKSGKEFVSTGNKLGDFLSVTKNVAKTGLKGFGKALLGGGLNMLLNAGIGALIEGGVTLAVKAYDKLAHAQEKTIEKGKEASQKIQDNYSSIASNDQWKNTNLERFTELAKGVSTTGKNISLTTEEFSEYQSLASDLAGIMPNLVVGFNELGQPIIKAATNMDTLNKAFRDSDVKKYQENMKNTSDVLDAFKTQYDEVGNIFNESGIKQKLAAYKDITSIYNDLKSQKLTDWQGNKFLKDRLRTSDKDGYDYNTIKDISKDLGIKTDELYENIDAVLEGEAQIRQEMDMVASSVKNSLPSFFKAKDSYHDIISKSPNVDAFVQSVISGLDSETILNTLGSEEDIKVWAEKITNGLQNKEVQNAIDGLYTIDQKKADMSFKAYDEQVRSFVKKIGKNIEGINEEQVLKGFDLDEEFSDLGKKYNKIANKFGEDFANGLSISDLELATNIISQQDVKNAEQLKQALLLAKEAAFDINANPIFDSIKAADETRNKGDDYVDALKYAKEAKEMYDKGIIGTDDFKARAKYLSPTGAEDPANFIENYGKATRYLTEDSSGVKNFLTDLSKKTDEAGNSLASFDKATGKWSYNIKDLSKAAHDMGMGFEFFMDMFGRLEDYGFSNNFFSSEKEGVEKLTDKISKLAKAKRELAELESRGENQTAINAKKEEIASLEQDQQQIRENLKQVAQESAERINDQISASKDAYKALKEERDKILANPDLYGENTDEIVAKMDEELKGLAQQGMFEIDGEMNIVNKDEVKEEIESTKPIIEAEVRTKDAIEQATHSVDTVQQLITNSGSDVKLDFGVTSEADINAQIAAIMNALEPLKNEKGNIPVSVDGAEEAKEALTALILKRQEAIQPAVMTIDTSQLESDIGEVISKVQEFQTAYNKVQELNTIRSSGLTVNTEEFAKAKQDLENALSELQALGDNPVTADILAKLEIDPNSIGSAESSIKDIKPELVAKLNTEEIESYKPVPQDADIILHVKDDEYVAYTPAPKDADVNYHPVDPEIQAYNPDDEDADVHYHVEDSEIQAYVPPDKDAIVKYSPDTSGLPTSFDPITRVVNYVKGSDPGSASGTMLSPAHTNGTAYNTLNMSSAHAGGNVAIQRDEKSLINEVGMESIVRDGIWRLIPGGAHIEQLKKGDIVFNASQTEQLLKYGSISGRGRAYADGTVGNVRDLVRNPLSAYANGAGHGQFWGGAATTASSSSKTDKTTNQISKNTKETADTVKDISNELSNYEDWVERRFKAIESEFAHLEAVFERMSHLPDRLAKAYDLLAKNKEYMNTVNSSKSTYQAHLDRIKGQGLSQDIIDKIQNGSLEISNYSEETKKLISEYETYYNKLRDCSSQYDELLAKQAELVQSTLDSITDYYDMMNGVDEASKGILEAQRELYEKLGVSVTAQDQKDSVNNSIKEQEKITDRLSAQVEAYASQIESLISSGYMERYSKEYYAAHETLNGLKQELLESQSALVEFQDKLYELEYAGIQNLINGFERAVDKLDAKIAYIKSKDEKVSESLYQEQINANNSQIREKMKLKAKKEQEQALYDVGSTRYQELADEINNLDKETYELLTTNEELKDSIFELRFADLEKEIQGYKDLRSEIEDFRSLLDEEAFFDKNGAITEDGLANLALLQQGMISAKKEIADYREGLDKLQESFDNGVISETEYNEKSAEYREGIRDSIKDVNDYEDSLKDLYITQMSKENEVLQKAIDQYAEARKRKADYFEYDKKLKGQQKSVDMLKAQIAALEGVKDICPMCFNCWNTLRDL